MTRGAEVRILDQPGVFIADAAELDGEWLHVCGRWRTRCGPNNEKQTFSERLEYTFPRQVVRRIRWSP